MPDARPIGFFDSGVGGLTVLRASQQRLPGESTIYIGDTARHPYGTRTDAEELRVSEELTDALVARKLQTTVIPCNAATPVAPRALRLRPPETPIPALVRPRDPSPTPALQVPGLVRAGGQGWQGAGGRDVVGWRAGAPCMWGVGAGGSPCWLHGNAWAR